PTFRSVARRPSRKAGSRTETATKAASRASAGTRPFTRTDVWFTPRTTRAGWSTGAVAIDRRSLHGPMDPAQHVERPGQRHRGDGPARDRRDDAGQRHPHSRERRQESKPEKERKRAQHDHLRREHRDVLLRQTVNSPSAWQATPMELAPRGAS